MQSNCDPLKTAKTGSLIIEWFQLVEKQKLMEKRTELGENSSRSFVGSSTIVDSDYKMILQRMKHHHPFKKQ